MKIKKLFLKNYRNYDEILLELNDGLNIIIGDNAQGKTNLLESIYVLAVTKSFLSINDKNLIMFNNSFSLIKGFIQYKDNCDELEVLLNSKGKSVKINKKEIKKLSFKTKMLKSLKKVPVLNKLEGFAKKHIGSRDYKEASDFMRKILTILNIKYICTKNNSFNIFYKI